MQKLQKLPQKVMQFRPSTLRHLRIIQEEKRLMQTTLPGDLPHGFALTLLADGDEDLIRVQNQKGGVVSPGENSCEKQGVRSIPGVHMYQRGPEFASL